MPILHRDLSLCISLSARPSNIGTRFHNYLYDELRLPYVYKAFAPHDLEQAIIGIRGLGIRGAAVSMPYKEAVIVWVDHLDASAAAIDSVNTIVNDDGVLTAYNTDYSAVARLVVDHKLDTTGTVIVRGSGGMAKAVVAALHASGFTRGVLVARNESAGRTLAAHYGWSWAAEPADLTADLIVNVTPIGMSGGPDAELCSFGPLTIAAASHIFDVVAVPAETPLIRAARALGTPVTTGDQVAAIQAEEQFVLYTGVRPSDEQVRAAAAFSREEVAAPCGERRLNE